MAFDAAEERLKIMLESQRRSDQFTHDLARKNAGLPTYDEERLNAIESEIARIKQHLGLQ